MTYGNAYIKYFAKFPDFFETQSWRACKYTYSKQIKKLDLQARLEFGSIQNLVYALIRFIHNIYVMLLITVPLIKKLYNTMCIRESHGDLLNAFQQRKVRWYRHTNRSSGLFKTIT